MTDPRIPDLEPAAPRRAAPSRANEDDFWDDEEWEATPSGRSGGGPSTLWVVAAVVAVLVVVALVAANRDEPDDGSGPGGQAESAASVQQCATWPAVGGLGAPEVVTKAGLHMWSDLKGWHLRRVPGEAVPALTATVNAADPEGRAQDVEPKGRASGGAKASTRGRTLTATLPAGDQPSQVDFEPGPFSSTVTIAMADAKGAPLPPTAFTAGAGGKATGNPIVATRVMQACS